MSAEPMTQDAAERAIATILRQLEADSGQLVDAVRLTRYDATTISSTRRSLVVQVSVDLVRPPAHGWAQAIPNPDQEIEE